MDTVVVVPTQIVPPPGDDLTRLQELMLYIAEKMQNKPRFGGTKLNKALFYADFSAYLDLGHSITGQTYVKKEFGPVPRDQYQAVQGLVDAGAAKRGFRSFGGGKTQKRLLPQRLPNLSLFAPEQIAVVDYVIEGIATRTASFVSNRSHEHLCWKLAEMGEEIPYAAALLTDGVAYFSDIARGMQLARERGWLVS